MDAGRGSPYLNLSVCVLTLPTLPRSPLSLPCVSISPAPSGLVRFLTFFLYLPLSSYRPSHFTFLGCECTSPSHPIPISLCPPFPFCTCVPIAHLVLFFLALGMCHHLPSCLPPPPRLCQPAFIPPPSMSPHSSLPRPKGTLALNLDGLRCGEKLYSQRLRQPPGWFFTPPPTPLSTFPTCCMPGVAGRGMPDCKRLTFGSKLNLGGHSGGSGASAEGWEETETLFT